MEDFLSGNISFPLVEGKPDSPVWLFITTDIMENELILREKHVFIDCTFNKHSFIYCLF